MATVKQRALILFERAIEELTRDGCALLPYDYVEIHNAAVRCVDVEGESPSQFSVMPVACGKALLQVPTIRAMHWWETCGQEWYGHDDVLAIMAIAYISQYGRDKERIERLYSRSKADMALLSYRMRLGFSCTTTELRMALESLDAAVDAVFPDGEIPEQDDDAEQSGSARIWGDTIARLCGAYHDLDPYEAAFRLSVMDAYSALTHAPTPYGQSKPENSQHFSRYAAFRKVVERIRKERKCSESA